MPTPRKGEKEADFVQRCIPMVISEGTAKDGAQAAAICHSMFAQHKKNHSEEGDSKTYAQTLPGVEIFATGKWNGDVYSETDLDAMVAASNKLPMKSPVKLGHTEAQRWFGQEDGAPALGWVENLRRMGGKLVADLVNVPDALVEMIRNGNYRTKSAEIYWNYIDPADPAGTKWPRVLKAVSLLGADLPAVTNLQELQRVLMSDSSYSIAYSADTGSATFKTYTIPDNDGGYTMDEKRYQEKIAMLESQLNAEKSLREQMEGRAVRAEATLATRDEDFAVKQFREVTLTALKQAGKVLPAEEESLIVTFSALGPQSKRYGDKDVNPREMFVKALHDRKTQIGFGASGDDGGDAPAAVEVDKRIRKFIEDGKAKDYSDGKELVKTRYPELWERYIRG